jgi:uncharacterized protein (DUF433 family)
LNTQRAVSPLLFNQNEENPMKNFITIDPDICNGKPIIAGTRISVQTIMEFLGAGDSIEEILEEYPLLSKEDIYACLQFATKLMANHYEIRKVA